MVTVTLSELRPAWRRTTVLSGTPFARAVRTKSRFITSSMLFRTNLRITAIAP